MKKIVLSVILLLCGYGNVFAISIDLSGRYTIGGGVSLSDATGTTLEDSFAGDSMTTPLPLFDAVSVLSDAAASALAAAGTGMLLVATDTAAKAGFAVATATADFSGSFLSPGAPLQLRLDVTHNAQASGAESAAQAILHIVLAGMGGMLWDEQYTFGVSDVAEQVLLSNFYLPPGALGSLDISLAALGGAADGAAGNLASVTFALNTVPEPAAWFTLLTGLGLLTLARRHPVAGLKT